MLEHCISLENVIIETQIGVFWRSSKFVYKFYSFRFLKFFSFKGCFLLVEIGLGNFLRNYCFQKFWWFVANNIFFAKNVRVLETGTSYEILRSFKERTQHKLVWKYVIIDKIIFFSLGYRIWLVNWTCNS